MGWFDPPAKEDQEEKLANEAAFPCEFDNELMSTGQGGMTKLEYFAGQVLANVHPTNAFDDHTARHVWGIAQTMLKNHPALQEKDDG